jgi:hypothetical protein
MLLLTTFFASMLAQERLLFSKMKSAIMEVYMKTLVHEKMHPRKDVIL